MEVALELNNGPRLEEFGKHDRKALDCISHWVYTWKPLSTSRSPHQVPWVGEDVPTLKTRESTQLLEGQPGSYLGFVLSATLLMRPSQGVC